MALVELLGEKLQKKAGEEETVDTSSLVGEGRYVGLYFSALWCPPCHGFTPNLARFYENLKQQAGRAEAFEVVLVSDDTDDDAFEQHFGRMPWLALPYSERQKKVVQHFGRIPWLALPYSERQKKKDLCKKYEVFGYPMLVLLDASSGDLITWKARDRIREDPEGKNFPWKKND
ncbi:NXN [Branchiostoma lanceolatum]|uniref:NXN protein n=1 Tax=Branchiostoma lanceolatum TaxID=7740 RepID=A0A8S4MMM6_BRALA|nr:NXN [Branchiostoma lanceolatum]